MSENRISNRKPCFQDIYRDGNEIKPIGLMFNISETGTNIWLDDSKTELQDEFIIRLRPPGETKILGYLDFEVKKIWGKDTKTQSYKKVGCQFTSLDHRKKDQLKSIVQHYSQIDELRKLKQQYSYYYKENVYF